MYNCGEKFVDYSKWCPSCKHKEDKVDEKGIVHVNPNCDECLETPARFGTSKPLNWTEK